MTPRLHWRDLDCKKIKIGARFEYCSDPKRKAKLLAFLGKTSVEVVDNNEDWDYAFATADACEDEWFYPAVRRAIKTIEKVENIDENDDWLVLEYIDLGKYGYEIDFVGIFNPKMHEKELEIERRVHNELVSVPAGRFKGLLVDGGVEYQRQITQLEQLTNKLK